MPAPSAAPSTNWCSPGAGGKIDKVAGIEARGFILGGAVAHQLSAGFVPIRKKGKLPHETVSMIYSLEYGVDEIEMHKDAILPGERVLLVDDLIATGGTASAAATLIRQMGGELEAACFIVDLPGTRRRRQAARSQRQRPYADRLRGRVRGPPWRPSPEASRYRHEADRFMTDLQTIALSGAAVDQPSLDKLLAAGAPRRLVGADLSGLTFGEVDLNGWQFETCNLGRCKLIRTRLADSRWANCKAAFADFSRADLIDAEIVASDFNNATFRQTILTSTAFRRCKLTGADFTDARTVDLTLEEVLAVDARLPKVSFRDQTLTQVDLSGALLEGADFRGVVFDDCSLRDAQLIRARFEGADLRGADLGGIRLGDAAHFRGAIISRAQATSLLKELGLKVL